MNHLPYKNERGYVNRVNAKSLPIHGIARGIDIRIRQWRGNVNIIVARLDDQKFYLGINFLDRAKAFIVPYSNTLLTADNKQLHAIPIKWEAQKERVFSTLRFLRKEEPDYLVALKIDEVPTFVMPTTPRES